MRPFGLSALCSPCLRFSLIGLLALGPWALAAARPAPAVQLEADSLTTQDGHVKLVWDVAARQEEKQWAFEVQVDSTAAFEAPTLLYQGPDKATFISGLPDGTYFYRIRVVGPEIDAPGPWEQAVVTVDHHSLNLALTIAGIGSVVFVLTVIVVLRGAASMNTEHGSGRG
jgi:hypothetical protein